MEDFKIQCVRCLICKNIFAIAVEKHIDSAWLKNCAKYIKTGVCSVETIWNSELGDQFGYGVAKCCGRKPKS